MKKQQLRLTVNGQEYELYVHPKTLLVEVIRDHLGLTGTKRGCETVSCGACTVMMDDLAVKSCSILAVQAEGRRITTVEGLERNGKLAPLQKAFLREESIDGKRHIPGLETRIVSPEGGGHAPSSI